ncbi:hypothetical protein BH11MYX3_BH11MYX3_08570 [soil metagenome]
MDLRCSYGTIRIVTRWMIVLVLAVFASTAGDADAQAFKPKRSTPVKGAPAKKAPAAAAKKAPASAPRRVVTSSKAPKKKGSRAAQTSGRAEDLTPDGDEPTSKSTIRDDDYVLIEDDDE